jgi:hypothetical protein
MGTRLGTLGTRAKGLLGFFRPKKRVPKFPETVDYEVVFKNHAALMNAYGTVLTRDAKVFDVFFRSLFVQSHIYKRLQLLKRTYLFEIATLYNQGNDETRLTLNRFVKDIGKLSSCLFYFPNIGWKEILFYILPTIAAATAILYHVRGFVPESWSHGVNFSAYLTILAALGLTFLIYLGFVALSFIEKRLFFVFPEYKAVQFFDRLKKRGEAFLGWKMEGTIYEKEDKLFHSLGMGKELESPIDVYLFMVIMLIISSILVTRSVITILQYAISFWLLILPITLFFALGRKAS